MSYTLESFYSIQMPQQIKKPWKLSEGKAKRKHGFLSGTTTKSLFLSTMFAFLFHADAQQNATSSHMSSYSNSSFNSSLPQKSSVNPLLHMPAGYTNNNATENEDIVSSAGLSLIVGLISFFTVVGNVMIILSVLIFRKLRKIPNMFIVSLATADLIMGGVVLPFGSHYVVSSSWLLGTFACDIWTSIDILSVTASICTLCAISLDRFVAITMPFQYSTRMTRNRSRLIIAFIWIISATIAFVPINLGWWKTNDPKDIKCYNDPYCCEFRINKTYAVVSSLVSFYIPLVVMIFAYSIVFKIAIQKRTKIRNHEGVFRRASMPGSRALLWGRGEYRAVFTMGIIMGTFVACWLPFFIANIVQVFCHRCMSPTAFTILNWLGYVNSFFNPIIYCHSKEFRRAFKRIVLCSLCREGYQQTSRASLSVSYTPSFSIRSSMGTESGIFPLTSFFSSSSQRKASRQSTESSKPKKCSPGFATTTNATSRSRTSNGTINGPAIYGHRSSRFESEIASCNDCDVDSNASKSDFLQDKCDETLIEENACRSAGTPKSHHSNLAKQKRSKSTFVRREPGTHKQVLFKTPSHNDIRIEKSNGELRQLLTESPENSSLSSVETLDNEFAITDLPLPQTNADTNNNDNIRNIEDSSDEDL